jgi:hypothetical protein
MARNPGFRWAPWRICHANINKTVLKSKFSTHKWKGEAPAEPFSGVSERQFWLSESFARLAQRQ